MIPMLLWLANISLAGEQTDWHAYNRLGLTADAAGRYGEAAEHFRSAQRASQGLPAAVQAMVVHNLAASQQRLNNWPEAARLYQEAFRLWDAADHKGSPSEMGMAWSNYAVLLRLTARYAESVEAARKAVRTLAPMGGAAAAGAYFELAAGLRLTAEPNAGLEAVRQGLVVAGENTVLHARLMEMEAMLLQDAGNASGGIARQREALRVYLRQLPSAHRYVASARNNLGQMLLAGGELAEAEELFEQARSASEAWPEPTTLAAAILNNLAQVRRAQKRLAEAEPLYRQARAMAERRTGRSHPDVAKITKNLGDLFFLQGKTHGAEQLYLEALAAMEAALGRRHAQTRQIADALGALYRQSERRVEYKRLLQRMAE